MAATIKKRILAQKIIAVCNPDFPTPAMIEFIGATGFDAVFIDCEHSSTDFKLVEDLTRAARVADMASVLRPWSNDPGLINRYLSCGAGGIQAPHVHNVADAQKTDCAGGAMETLKRSCCSSWSNRRKRSTIFPCF